MEKTMKVRTNLTIVPENERHEGLAVPCLAVTDVLKGVEAHASKVADPEGIRKLTFLNGIDRQNSSLQYGQLWKEVTKLE